MLFFFSLKMKEYTFASALLLNNNICVYFPKCFIRFSVAYESKQYLKYPGTTCTTLEFDRMENCKTDKNHLMFL